MHIFVVHQYPDFDSMAPVVYKINETYPGKASILSIYPVFDFKKFDLMKFLLKKDTKYFDLSNINLKNNFLKIFLNFLVIFPKFFLNKLNFFYRFLYHKSVLFSDHDIIKFIKRHNIKSITIDDQASLRLKKVFRSATLNTNIKFYIFKIGIEMRKNIYINIENSKLSDLYILGDNKILIPNKETLKSVERFNAPRFSNEWLEILERINKYKLNDYKEYDSTQKLKILILPRPIFKLKAYSDIYESLIKNDNLDIKILTKPRGDLGPIKINKGFEDLGTSNYINWADIIISQSTSVLFEALIKKKNIFFLDYLIKTNNYLKNHDYSKEKYYIEDSNCIKKITSLDSLMLEIDYIITNGKLNKPDESSEIFIQNYLGKDYNKINISDNYLKNV